MASWYWGFGLTLIAGLGASAAHADIYLKLEGLPAHSNSERGRAQEFRVLSTTWDTRHSAGMAAGRRPGLEVANVVMPVSADAAMLSRAAASGQQIPNATLTFVKDAGVRKIPYLTITLQNVLVTQFSVNGQGRTATERVTLSFEKMTARYTDTAPTSSHESDSWDIPKQTSR
jgi:type VI protein secretion system component Hcp